MAETARLAGWLIGWLVGYSSCGRDGVMTPLSRRSKAFTHPPPLRSIFYFLPSLSIDPIWPVPVHTHHVSPFSARGAAPLSLSPSCCLSVSLLVAFYLLVGVSNLSSSCEEAIWSRQTNCCSAPPQCTFRRRRLGQIGGRKGGDRRRWRAHRERERAICMLLLPQRHVRYGTHTHTYTYRPRWVGSFFGSAAAQQRNTKATGLRPTWARRGPFQFPFIVCVFLLLSSCVPAPCPPHLVRSASRLFPLAVRRSFPLAWLERGLGTI